MNQILFWLGVVSILLMQAVRCLLVARLRTEYPRIYEGLGRPRYIGRMHAFSFDLTRRDVFGGLSPADRSIVRLLRVLFVLPFVFVLGAIATLRVS